MQAIPALLSGRDVIGLSETGSGKTLAFVLPLHALLQSISPVSPGFLLPQRPLGVILAPTRELALQTLDTCCSYGFFRDARVPSPSADIRTIACFVGGTPVHVDAALLSSQRVDVVVATLGRLLHLLTSSALSLDRYGT
jgi:ATP-dependent RNA helicase DDX46/PRP5